MASFIPNALYLPQTGFYTGIMGLRYYGCVYMITSRVDHKYYIGQTTGGIDYRWSLHKSEARRRLKTHFHKAVRKHGEDQFDIQVVAEAKSAEELDQLERLWIWALDAINPTVGYNHSTGGNRPHPSLETRRKMSEWQIGRKLPEKTLLKISAFFKGKPKSAEHRRKLSAANKGTPPSESARRAVSEANRRRVHSAETRAKLREAGYRAHKVRWGYIKPQT
jgi:group I intron endonuclease